MNFGGLALLQMAFRSIFNFFFFNRVMTTTFRSEVQNQYHFLTLNFKSFPHSPQGEADSWITVSLNVSG